LKNDFWGHTGQKLHCGLLLQCRGKKKSSVVFGIEEWKMKHCWKREVNLFVVLVHTVLFVFEKDLEKPLKIPHKECAEKTEK